LCKLEAENFVVSEKTRKWRTKHVVKLLGLFGFVKYFFEYSETFKGEKVFCWDESCNQGRVNFNGSQEEETGMEVV
jgi:hypothetical protein